ALTNDSIVKLVGAGLGEDTIIGIVNTQPGKYSVAADDIIALKKAAVPEKVIAAMLNKPLANANSAPGPAPSVDVIEVCVYLKKGDAWIQMMPEVVNWKTGGVLKSIGTAGIVKGDVNGRLNGETSRNSLTTPAELLICVPEGVEITEYQLLHLHEHNNGREF